MAKKFNITTTSNKPNIKLVARAMQRSILEVEEAEENEKNSGNN